MEKIKKFLSRKLLVFILAPVLSGMLLAVNKLLGDVLTGDQVNSIVMKIIDLAMVAIGVQGTVDAVGMYKTGVEK